MRTTIKDIAKQTGLSITTVSLVLNHKGERFPSETKDLVLEAARNLDYRPNQLAVGLLTKQTHTIGLIIPDIRNVFFSELAKGIEDRGRQERYNMIRCNSSDEYLVEKQCVNTLSDRGVDGIVMVMSAESFGEKNEECLALLRSLGIPIVLVDSFNEVSDFSTMAIDNAEGSRLGMRKNHTLFKPHLVIRQSTAKPASWQGQEFLAMKEIYHKPGKDDRPLLLALPPLETN